MSSLPERPPINLDITLGALLIGTYISTTLFGFTSLQTYSYYNTYVNDRVFLRVLVAVIWVLELIHTIFITRTYYELSVINFGSFADFIRLPFVLKFSIVWSNSISCGVQAFFANRIRIMSGRWELAVICWSLSAVRYVTSLTAAAEEIKISVQTEFNGQWKWIIIFVLAVGAVNDILIALGLGFYLSRNKSGISSSDRVVNKLIKFTVQSGLITSVLAIAMLICYLSMPDNFIWLAIFVCLAKTYSNSFLATLNARNTLRSGLNTSDGAVVFNGGNTSSSLGSGIKFNSASRSRADTDITSITFSKRPTAPIAIEMSNVTSTKAEGDSRTKDNEIGDSKKGGPEFFEV
ncbi:hypothetical protein PNOK_0152800 [Pyrrhoderma noxium]|uniref:DUF6534 domain-containing protein n=1 Tax=Pyrrhoderma noxium TaxID=2282107 RepID=A0A286UPN9_9AGAM|nr:hypothetical protein PNOK_0152800 [Pyrrhoderma noxium]